MNKNTISICTLIVFLATGCQSVPESKEVISQASNKVNQLDIKGSNNMLSQKQVDRVIDNLTNTKEEEELLEKQLKIAQGITDQPLIAGNDTEILFDGEQTFKVMKETIESAKNHVNLEYFIFENVDLGNQVTLESLLIKKRADGVDVNIIYDAIGSSSTPSSFFETLNKAGVKLTEFHPIDVENIGNLNHRDHRKILVVDGKVAIIGGINLSQTYQSKQGFSSSRKNHDVENATDAETSKHWRDTDLLIKGPAVAELQKLFLKHWDQSIDINQSGFYPKLETQGKEFVRVIGSSPQDNKPYFYSTLISAIDNASKKVILNSAYFVPTEDQKESLTDAAKRGIKIDLMLPGLSDSSLSLNVQRSYYEDLLENGVDIFEIESQILHAKTISIDGVWSVVGSSNFDFRSASLNDEVDVIVLGHKTAKQLNEKFRQDEAEAKKIELNVWKKRPLFDKVKQYLSRVFRKLL
ncbi:phospholipase D-like domain-containing protein [Methylotenera versatilis]|uniref:Phospholipase D/Transphosphatidylase n=1 Tax=Methylotenera versatilis (strain 301) TaxID=666681 RepID=D7DJH2_METV0|nr:phospholipase D-like domain-containing protein [Methylotenera versatilis]ADI30207.1 phospholipase D/Transphosphatidylase [Methylotenera versatilis 301]